MAFEKSKETISSSSESEIKLNRFGRKPIKKHLNDEFCYGSGRQIDSPPKLNQTDDTSEEERGIEYDTGKCIHFINPILIVMIHGDSMVPWI